MDTEEALNKLKAGIALNNVVINNLSFHSIMEEETINEPVVIKNSEIGFFDASIIKFKQQIKLESCKLKKIGLHGIVVDNGLIIKNCTIESSCDFSCSIIEAGQNSITLVNNFFGDIVTFEDTDFKDPIVIKDNTFQVGTDLNTVKQLQCSYPDESDVSNNTGVLGISPMEEEGHWERLRSIDENV
jgi:hypothetical protein